MIEIGMLKRQLDKFSDRYMVAAIEDDESSMLAIYKRCHMEPTPVGYISTLGGLTVIYTEEEPEVGEDITGVEILVDDS